NIRCSTSGSMPQPVSLTSKHTCLPSFASGDPFAVARSALLSIAAPVETRTIPSRSPRASLALITRFITICRSCVASASTAGGEAGVAEHTGEQVVEIMRDAACENAEAFEFLRLLQLCLHGSPLLQRAPTVADVPVKNVQPQSLARVFGMGVALEGGALSINT